MTKLRSAGEDVDTWMREVRDPADQATEGRRVVVVGELKAEYEVAPLPGGTWAMRMQCEAKMAGMSSPWREFPTREACVQAFLEEARDFFGREGVSKAKAKARAKFVELLSGQGSLFGFVEPDPSA